MISHIVALTGGACEHQRNLNENEKKHLYLAGGIFKVIGTESSSE